MNLSILCVGKLKEPYLKQAQAEYEKRLKGYLKLEILEAADEKAPEHLSAAEREAVLEKEGQSLIKALESRKGTVIALCIDGKEMDSVRFSETLSKAFAEGGSRVNFLIGGSNGLSEEAVRRADLRLSISPMTFPHQLCRIILLEQIYRAMKILKHEPYHK